MGKPSHKVLDLLVGTLSHLQLSPDLTSEDAQRLRQFAVHLIAEYTALRENPISSEKPSGPVTDRVNLG